MERVRNCGRVDEHYGEGSIAELVPAVVCPIPNCLVLREYELVEGLDEIRVAEMEVGEDDEATTRRMPILASSWSEP